MSIAFYWKEKAAIVTFLIITINKKKNRVSNHFTHYVTIIIKDRKEKICI